MGRCLAALSHVVVLLAGPSDSPTYEPSTSASTWIDPSTFVYNPPIALNVNLTTPQNIPFDSAEIGGNDMRRLPLDPRTVERQLEQDVVAAFNYERQMYGLTPYVFSDNLSAALHRYYTWMGMVNPEHGCPTPPGMFFSVCHSSPPLWNWFEWINNSRLGLADGGTYVGVSNSTPVDVFFGSRTSPYYAHRVTPFVYHTSGAPVFLGVGISCLPNGKSHVEALTFRRISSGPTAIHPAARLKPGDEGFHIYVPGNFGRHCPQPPAPLEVTTSPEAITTKAIDNPGPSQLRVSCRHEITGPSIWATTDTHKVHARITGNGVNQDLTWDWFSEDEEWNDIVTNELTVQLPPGEYTIEYWQSNLCETSKSGTTTVVVPAADTTTTTTPRTTTTTTTPRTTTTTTTTTPVPPGAAFTPITPFRALDTRLTWSPLAAGETRQVAIGGIPTSATAATLNVTAVDPTGDGFLSVMPCDAVSGEPSTSNINFRRGRNVPNQVTVRVKDGKVCVHSSVAAHVIIDVSGWWSQTNSGVTPSPVTQVRVADTRLGIPTTAVPPGGTLSVDLSRHVAPDVSSVTINVTATEPTSPTYLTVYPCWVPRPNSSNLNLAAGEVRANLVTVPLNATRHVCIFNERGSVHVIVDLNVVWRGGASSHTLSPLDRPVRVVDTRHPGEHMLGQVIRQIHPPTNGLVFANATIVDASETGYVSLFPCAAGDTGTSSVNASPGDTNANAVLIDATTGVCGRSHRPVHFLFDVFAYLRPR